MINDLEKRTCMDDVYHSAREKLSEAVFPTPDLTVHCCSLSKDPLICTFLIKGVEGLSRKSAVLRRELGYYLLQCMPIPK